jgi:cytochrome c oxidase subunit II
LRAQTLVHRARQVLVVLGAALLGLLVLACASVPNHNPTGDANTPSLLPGQVVTTQGQAAVNLYLITFVVAVIVFVLVEGLLLFISLRYRRRKGDDALPTQTHGNSRLEILWTLIPALTVTGLFIGVLMTLTNETEVESSNPAVTVDVTGFQWQWTFAYPGYLAADGKPISFTGEGSQGPEMVVPIDVPVRINVTGQDVIHSFYVPQFFYKKDAIPGHVNSFDINVTEVGTYGGQCAEFCGLGHDSMFFTVRAVTESDFDQWASDAVAQANATPPPQPSGAAGLDLTAISATAGFKETTLTAPANAPITINFHNSDGTVVHNVAIKGANPDGTDWVGQPLAQPNASQVYTAPALKPGTYQFYCAVHPTTMTGTLTVTP